MKVAGRLRTLCALSALALTVLAQEALADRILGLRAFTNTDKTRVVVDLDFEPKHSDALSNNGNTFVLRVNDVENYAAAPATLEYDPRSVIRGFEKNLSGDDVRYVFTLEGAGTPNVFLLRPMDNHPYRLVADFPHTANSRQPASEQEVRVIDAKTADERRGTGTGSGVPPLRVITINEADAAENALLSSLSSVGSDGIRTMTPEQAMEYKDRMEQLREQQQIAMTQVQRPQQIQQAQSAREEVVQDTPAPPKAAQPAPLPVLKPYIIAIDAGHGGKDPGAIGRRGVREKNVTLAIARALDEYIKKNPAFKSKMIRSSDVFVDLDKRSEIARSNKADILISIHADSVASGSSARGASIWVLSTNRADRENSKVLKSSNQQNLLGGLGEVLSGTDDQNPYLAATILAMSSDNNRSEGYTLGQEILDRLGRFTKLHKKTPIHASLAVLKSPDIPSLLIETGFLSNPQEEIQLNQPNYQKQIAYCIYQGIESYYQKYTMERYKSRVESALRTGSVTPDVYVVQSGDSLSVIARRHGITLEQLKRYNNLKDNNIRVGQKLVVYKGLSNDAASAMMQSGVMASAAQSGAQASPAAPSIGAKPESYVVQSGDSLSVIAQRFDVPVSEIRDLNGLRDNNIRVGQRLVLRRAVAAAPAPAPAPTPAPVTPSTGSVPESYVVRSGDSLSVIAQRFDVPVSEIRELNGLRDNNIRVGQKLVLRKKSEAQKSSAVSSASSTSAAASSAPEIYVVKNGDSLSVIAQRFDVPLSELRSLNGLKDNNIRIGQKLRLRKTAQAAVPVAQKGPEIYVVQSGDSLSVIAQKLNVTTESLKRHNNLKDNNIRIGQKLAVPR